MFKKDDDPKKTFVELLGRYRRQTNSHTDYAHPTKIRAVVGNDCDDELCAGCFCLSCLCDCAS